MTKEKKTDIAKLTDHVTSVDHIKGDKSIKMDETSVPKTPKKFTSLTVTPRAHRNPLGAMTARFKEHFNKDLLGFIGKKTPRFRVVTSGGYGMKTLIEQKHGMYGKVRTGDMDITVSTYKASMSPTDAFQYWSKAVQQFIYKQGNPDDFMVKVVNFGGETVPLMNFKRYYVIMISYRVNGVFKDFVDVAITDMRIKDNMIEVPTSIKAGIPLKKEEYYLQEFMTLIYMENVPGVSDYAYSKRNPVDGKVKDKGVKDIMRSKLLCYVKRRNRYAKYCELLRNITIAKLREMPKDHRDVYFKSFNALLDR